MNTTTVPESIRRVGRRTTARLERVRPILFGDRLGYVLFLGSLVLFVCYWRIGFLTNDNYTIANTLLAVEEGQLYFTEATYGKLGSPGTHLVDGKVYGRNYGHVVLTLPFLIAIRGLSAVFDLSVAVVAGWSLLLLAVSLQLGRLVERHRAAAVSGSSLALCAFVVGVATVQPISHRSVPVMALQVSTMVATAMGVVLMYRLVSRLHNRRTGVAAGLAYAAILPTAFWASVPKRHALTTTLLVASLYLLYRARVTEDTSEGTRFRALAYVPVGLTAWIHAPEAFVLLASIGLSDVVTAESNGRRQFTTVAIVLSLSLVPFFVTNYLIAGNPLEPPRFLPSYDTVRIASESATDAAGGGTGTGMLMSILDKPAVLLERFTDGLMVLLTEPNRIINTFIVSLGFESGDRNLSVLESAPLLGVIAAYIASLPRRVWTHRPLVRLRPDRPETAVSLAAIVYAILLVLAYMPSLPLYAQITVRYLLPLYPLSLLVVVRLKPVQSVLDREWRLLAWTYAGGTLVGSQLFVAVIVLIDALLRETIQLGAFLSLGIAVILGAWGVTYTTGYDGDYATKAGAVLLGLAAASGTAFLLVSAWWYFPYGPFALPFVPRP